METPVLLLMGVDADTEMLLTLHLESSGIVPRPLASLAQAAAEWRGAPPAWCMASARAVEESLPEQRWDWMTRLGATALYVLLEPTAPPPRLESWLPLYPAEVITKPLLPESLPDAFTVSPTIPAPLRALEAWRTSVGLETELLCELAESYIARGDDYLRTLAQGGKDAAVLLTAAHALKGMAANLRLHPVAALAGALSHAAREQAWMRVEQLRPALESAHRDLCRAMSAQWPAP